MSDWLDLVHWYLLQHVEPEKQYDISVSLTGDLDQFDQPGRDTPVTTLPRPPAWSHIPLADINRFAAMRAAQQQEQPTE